MFYEIRWRPFTVAMDWQRKSFDLTTKGNKRHCSCRRLRDVDIWDDKENTPLRGNAKEQEANEGRVATQ